MAVLNMISSFAEFEQDRNRISNPATATEPFPREPKAHPAASRPLRCYTTKAFPVHLPQ